MVVGQVRTARIGATPPTRPVESIIGEAAASIFLRLGCDLFDAFGGQELDVQVPGIGGEPDLVKKECCEGGGPQERNRTTDGNTASKQGQ